MTAPGVSPRSDDEAAHVVYNSRQVLDSRTYPPDEAWTQLQAVAEALLVEREDREKRIEELRRDYAKLWDMTVGAAERGPTGDATPDDMDAMAERAGIAYDRLILAERDALAAERDELRAKVAAVEAQRDDALVLLADAIPDPKGAIDSPQWHRRMDRLAASLDDGTAREFNDCRSTSHDVGAALAAASPGDGLGVWCCPAGHEIDQAGMCACDPPAPEWTFEDVDDEHTLITIRHADGSEIKYRVRRRPLFGASPGDEETDDV